MSAPPKRTPLHGLHESLGARMVEFAGYHMPVQYPAGIIREHLHTRSQTGLFDVSHMGQLHVSGARAAAALERLMPADITGLAPMRQRYTVLTNEAGGVLDDLMVSNAGSHYFLVVNASRKAEDLEHLRARIGGECTIRFLDDRALLALQGPGAASVMAEVCPDAVALGFMGVTSTKLLGAPVFVSRSGYTGEDGFEISVPAAEAERVARALLSQPGVAPIGLGARDSLRLEAGLCLYGHELDESTSPVEAGLAWTIGKARRSGGERGGGFPGHERILAELASGPLRKRVGLLPEGRAPVREGEELIAGGESIGKTTSGGFGPSLDAPLAMAYVAPSHASPGTTLEAIVRGKPRVCKVVDLPFLPHRYAKRQ
jgi:aminomethyltransferase